MLITMENVIDLECASRLVALIEQGPVKSGKSTAAGSAAEVKNNLQLAPDSEAARQARELLLSKLQTDSMFKAATFPREFVAPVFSRYDVGMSYGAHLDNPLMGTTRVDVSVSVFLNDGADYDGGELVIDTGYGIQTIKGNAGDCVIYPSNTHHHVSEVTRGVRYAGVLWIESQVRDPAQRKLLHDLGGAIRNLDLFSQPTPQLEVIRRCYTNLLRMWV